MIGADDDPPVTHGWDALMLKAAEAFPMNLGFLGKGNASRPEALSQQIAAGGTARGPVVYHCYEYGLYPFVRNRIDVASLHAAWVYYTSRGCPVVD